MMRRYPAYKDSGVEWLGEVPHGWEIINPRRIFAQMRELAHPDDEQLSATQKSGVVPQRLYIEQEDQKVVLALAGTDNFKRVQTGDFVISLRSFQGGIEYSAYDGCVSPAYTVLRPTRSIIGSYFRYLLKTEEFILKLQSVTSGIRDGRNVSYEQFATVPLCAPPLPEQTAIAAFLDRETARIDALVAEQRRLIDLLKEKRQAVISHAVTKGLNPNAKLKPAGIDWLGDVPEGWDVCQLKRVFKRVDYGISDSLSSEGPVGILRMGNISDGQVVLDDLKYADEVPPDLMLTRDDLLFNRTNSLDLIGKVGRFEPVDDAKISFASYLVRIRLEEKYGSPRFFAYLLNTPAILAEARANALVAIGQCNLNPTRYGQFWIALPPRDEQEEIVDYLGPKTAKLDTLTNSAESAITLLQERRAALISAAVTGKIDVRENVSDEVAA